MTVPVLSRRRAVAARRRTLLLASRIGGAIAAVGGAVAGTAVLVRRRRTDDAEHGASSRSGREVDGAAARPQDPVVPSAGDPQANEQLDAALAASFPASDPPGYP